MTLTLDINILVARTNVESAHFVRATNLIEDLSTGAEFVYLFWPVIVGYLRVVTRPGLLKRPLTLSDGLDNVQALLARPHVRMGAESRTFWQQLRSVAEPIPARGKLIHDAHLVALMHEHGVSTIYTNDRDFRKFDDIRVVDPFA